MTVSVKITMDGLPKLVRALSSMTPERNARILTMPMREWAIDTQMISKDQYLTGPRPQRLGVVTGRLRSSIGIDLLGVPRFVDVGTDVVYGPTHEFGDPSRNIPARPFLRPAAEEAFAHFETDLLESWEREVSR